MGLTIRREVGQKIMVSTAQQTVIGCSLIVLLVTAVHHGHTLCGLQEHERNRFTSNLGLAYFLPIYFALMMAHVKTTNGIAFRVCRIAEDASPADGEGAHEQAIEYIYIDTEQKDNAKNPSFLDFPSPRPAPKTGVSGTSCISSMYCQW